MKKALKILWNMWGIFSLLACMLITILIVAGNSILINPENLESIKIYQDIYEKINNENFVKGIRSINDSLVLIDNQGCENEIDLTVSNLNKYFYEIEKNERGDIVFKKSGGIFDDDYEIIFTSSLCFDQNKYIEIKNIEKDIFLCQLR